MTGLRRRGRAVLVTLSLAAMAAGTLGPAGSAEAADPPRVLAVSLSSSSVAVDGLVLAEVTVTAPFRGGPTAPPSAPLRRPPPATEPSATPQMIALLEHSSGSPGSGTYQGTV